MANKDREKYLKERMKRIGEMAAEKNTEVENEEDISCLREGCKFNMKKICGFYNENDKAIEVNEDGLCNSYEPRKKVANEKKEGVVY